MAVNRANAAHFASRSACRLSRGGENRIHRDETRGEGESTGSESPGRTRTRILGGTRVRIRHQTVTILIRHQTVTILIRHQTVTILIRHQTVTILIRHQTVVTILIRHWCDDSHSTPDVTILIRHQTVTILSVPVDSLEDIDGGGEAVEDGDLFQVSRFEAVRRAALAESQSRRARLRERVRRVADRGVSVREYEPSRSNATSRSSRRRERASRDRSTRDLTSSPPAPGSRRVE